MHILENKTHFKLIITLIFVTKIQIKQKKIEVNFNLKP